MKAIVVHGPGNAQVDNIPEPKIRPQHVKVKVMTVALNPTDWKHVDAISDKGAVIGCDYAGTVVEVGPAVKADVKIGDRVAGWVHGGNLSNHQDGCFAEYAVAKDGVFTKIPDHMSFEEASTLGIGISTVALALYQQLDIPWPEDSADVSYPILINGGSTATGTLAIQFAKLSGLEVIATASPQNHALLLSLGADRALDYKAPTCASDIRILTNDSLQYCLDCVSTPESLELCTNALSPTQPGYYSSLLGVTKPPRDGITVTGIMAYTIFGEAYMKFGMVTEASPGDYEFGVEFWNLAQRLLEARKLTVHPPQIEQGGLYGILRGLELMRAGKVSAKKLVYRIADT